jgi:hypothetical protein
MGRTKGSTNKGTEQRDQDILQIAREVTENYAQTIRHIYYRSSGAGVVVKDHGDSKSGYNQVCLALDRARFSGDLPWGRIIDGSRNAHQTTVWTSAKEYLRHIAENDWLHCDLWANQPEKPIVVTEKDAIVSMLSSICQERQVSIYPLKGHSSTTFLKTMAEEIRDILDAGKQVSVFYLGDGDPHGLSIDYSAFVDPGWFPCGKVSHILHEVLGCQETFSFIRLGVNPEDIFHPAYVDFVLPAYKPDHNGGRFVDWLDQAGYTDLQSLGIDALPAEELIDRVTKAIDSCTNPQLWKTAESNQEDQRKYMRTAASTCEGAADAN